MLITKCVITVGEKGPMYEPKKYITVTTTGTIWGWDNERIMKEFSFLDYPFNIDKGTLVMHFNLN